MEDVGTGDAHDRRRPTRRSSTRSLARLGSSSCSVGYATVGAAASGIFDQFEWALLVAPLSSRRSSRITLVGRPEPPEPPARQRRSSAPVVIAVIATRRTTSDVVDAFTSGDPRAPVDRLAEPRPRRSDRHRRRRHRHGDCDQRRTRRTSTLPPPPAAPAAAVLLAQWWRSARRAASRGRGSSLLAAVAITVRHCSATTARCTTASSCCAANVACSVCSSRRCPRRADHDPGVTRRPRRPAAQRSGPADGSAARPHRGHAGAARTRPARSTCTSPPRTTTVPCRCGGELRRSRTTTADAGRRPHPAPIGSTLGPAAEPDDRGRGQLPRRQPDPRAAARALRSRSTPPSRPTPIAPSCDSPIGRHLVTSSASSPTHRRLRATPSRSGWRHAWSTRRRPVSPNSPRVSPATAMRSNELGRLETTMREEFVLDNEVQGGGLEQALIDRFLRDTQRGTAEQFATSFVLLARSLGIEARVATGFVAGEDGGARSPPGEPLVLSSADAEVWPEVQLNDGTLDRLRPGSSRRGRRRCAAASRTPGPDSRCAPAADRAATGVRERDHRRRRGRRHGVGWCVVDRAHVGDQGFGCADAHRAARAGRRRSDHRRQVPPAPPTSARPRPRPIGCRGRGRRRPMRSSMPASPSNGRRPTRRSHRRGAPFAPDASAELRRLATMSSSATFGTPRHPDMLADESASCLGSVEQAVLAVRTRWQRLRWRLSLRSLRRATRSPVTD